MASRPPGRTMRHSSATCRSMSGTKKMPNTHTTASKWPSGKPSAVMSARRNSAWRSPAARAFVRASSSSGSARSTPSTAPRAPTACAAGSAEAPLPQHASSTRAPGSGARRSIVRRPLWAQKPSGSASKQSAAAL